MITANELKFIKSLHQKKNREEEGLFIAEGKKVVGDLLRSSIKVNKLFYTKDFEPVDAPGLEFSSVTEGELERMSALTSPQQVLALCEIPKSNLDLSNVLSDYCLVLDDIKDPGNLGTIIRIADWFGIPHIICSPETVDVYNPKVVQGSMGSIARVHVHYTGLGHFLTEAKNKNVPVYGTVLQGENLYKSDLTKKGVLVFGNESKGMSDIVASHITHKITIPLYQQGVTVPDSLNVGVSVAIVCSEVRRK